MALDHLVGFHDSISREPSIQRALDGVADADLPDRMAEIGRGFGYEFDAEEVRAMMARKSDGPAEIKDSDLAGVAAGLGVTYPSFNPTSGFNQLSTNLDTVDVDREAFPGDNFFPAPSGF